MRNSPGRVLIVSAALLAAGCAAAGSSAGSSAKLTSADHSSVTTVPTAAQLAQTLLNEARVPAGAVRSAAPPIKELSQAPERQSAQGLIVLRRWWRINESWTTVFNWISHHQSLQLDSTGGSSTSGPHESEQQSDADFAPPRLPATVNSAQLSVAVAPLTADTSAIGVYSLVVPQPTRPQIENVPSSVDSVLVITLRTTGQQDGGGVLGRRTLTGAAARRLVDDFNALSVQPAGEVFSCPMSMVTQTAIFQAPGHRWIATSGVCVGITVTVNGHALPTLDGSNSFERDLRAAYGHRFPSLLHPQPAMIATAPTSTVNQ
jgi:hypothetical protein